MCQDLRNDNDLPILKNYLVQNTEIIYGNPTRKALTSYYDTIWSNYVKSQNSLTSVKMNYLNFISKLFRSVWDFVHILKFFTNTSREYLLAFVGISVGLLLPDPSIDVEVISIEVHLLI